MRHDTELPHAWSQLAKFAGQNWSIVPPRNRSAGSRWIPPNAGAIIHSNGGAGTCPTHDRSGPCVVGNRCGQWRMPVVDDHLLDDNAVLGTQFVLSWAGWTEDAAQKGGPAIDRW